MSRTVLLAAAFAALPFSLHAAGPGPDGGTTANAAAEVFSPVERIRPGMTVREAQALLPLPVEGKDSLRAMRLRDKLVIFGATPIFEAGGGKFLGYGRPTVQGVFDLTPRKPARRNPCWAETATGRSASTSRPTSRNARPVP